MKNKNTQNDDIDALIGQKLSEKIALEMQLAEKIPEIQKITDFNKVPDECIFSKSATYLVFNRSTSQKSYVNGEQAESFIGLHREIRQKLSAKLADNFTVGDYYVKFSSLRYEDA